MEVVAGRNNLVVLSIKSLRTLCKGESAYGMTWEAAEARKKRFAAS